MQAYAGVMLCCMGDQHVDYVLSTRTSSSNRQISLDAIDRGGPT